MDLQEMRVLATLAALELDDEEIEQASSDLDRMLEVFAVLDAEELDGVEPMFRPPEEAVRLAPDHSREPPRSSEYLRLAPAERGGFYEVPRVLR